jgi:hypothetical protein
MNRLQHLLDRGLIGYGLLHPHEKTKDDGNGRLPGAVNANMLVDPAHVSAGSVGRASGLPSLGPKGGTVYGSHKWNGNGVDHLDDPRLQRQTYPGHKVKRQRGRGGVKGGVIGSGPPWGSRGRSKTSY